MSTPLALVASKGHGVAPQPTQKTTDSIVPWFPSPIDGWNEELECFSPRHGASTIELFFDLWFVANLATFTQYHAITNRYTFWSYLAFFVVLWTSWFHVVCFDARFTSDSVWERASKTVHFFSFAALALVGYKFAPVAQNVQEATPHWVYRVLCFALLLSRAWLALQYTVTAISCSKAPHRKLQLRLPLALNAALFASVAGIFGGLFADFSNVEKNLTYVIIGLYIVLIVELLGALSISMIWRRVSFKATHIGERLGLLGLIIIGEGVIGTTKTITRTMGKSGPLFAESAQMFCIVLILVFMWILYFDRLPHYRFNTVKQHFWMALHLPFHLAILGVVEGTQQLVQARYVYATITVLLSNAWKACVGANLEGEALVGNLTRNIQSFKIDESARGLLALPSVYQEIYNLGNISDVCTPANTIKLQKDLTDLPTSFAEFFIQAAGALVQSLNIEFLPDGETETVEVAVHSWNVVYVYFWSAIILLEMCYILTSFLADGERGDWRSMRRYVTLAIISRGCMVLIAVAVLVMGALNRKFQQEYVASGWILPTVVLMLWSICICDRVGKLYKQRKEKGQDYESIDGVTGERRDSMPMGFLRRSPTNAYGYPSN